jgi:hypothetical protein
MASILKVDALQGITAANDITINSGSVTMPLQEGIATAKISGDNAATLFADSFNIASGLDAGTGSYRYTLTNVSVRTTWNQTSAGVTLGATAVIRAKSANSTTSVIDIETMNSSFSVTNANHGFIFMGDLA